MLNGNPIPVTKPFMPSLAEYSGLLTPVWENRILTNGGPLLLELTAALKSDLNVPELLITTNGTIALQIALKALALEGEVITTPFSYIATSASIAWQNLTPVFVDIESDYWCIDPAKIEAAITPRTQAILATHVFGNPCDVHAISAIAEKHQLKVIYDAAHGYGVNYQDTSIFNYGDISACSFHATKIFHTGEGGALVTGDKALYQQLVWLQNQGHEGEEAFYGIGTNGKTTELQAAMGLAVLPHVAKLIALRRERFLLYDQLLDQQLTRITLRAGTQWNFGYYPVLFKHEAQMLLVKKQLNEEHIYPRRYFYPSLNTLPFSQNKKMIISENVASRILCLPLYHDLELHRLQRIAQIINELVANRTNNTPGLQINDKK